MRVSSAKVMDILESMYPSRRCKVPLFIGAPGIGKTQGVFAFARKRGAKVVQFILSNTIPSEVSGIRMPDNDTKKLEVFDDSRMASLEDGDVLFFDEILQAPPILWSACLTLIQDRVMASGRPLPDVMIVAASNPVVSPGIIPPSVRDRFDIIELKFDFPSWRQWFMENYGVDPKKVELRLQEDSDQYNVLTPRKFTSTYLWARQVHESGGDMDLVYEVIAAEFDREVASTVRELACPVKDEKRQIVDAVEKMGFDVDGLYDKSLEEILETLQSLLEWPKIKEVLGSIQVE